MSLLLERILSKRLLTLWPVSPLVLVRDPSRWRLALDLPTVNTLPLLETPRRARRTGGTHTNVMGWPRTP